MNHFVRPEFIPGASYDVQTRPGWVDIWIYCPTHDGDPEPWLVVEDSPEDNRATWRSLPDDAIIHGDGPVYNPHHPPTFRNQNFCPGCAKTIPDVPGQEPVGDEHE